MIVNLKRRRKKNNTKTTPCCKTVEHFNQDYYTVRISYLLLVLVSLLIRTLSEHSFRIKHVVT